MENDYNYLENYRYIYYIFIYFKNIPFDFTHTFHNLNDLKKRINFYLKNPDFYYDFKKIEIIKQDTKTGDILSAEDLFPDFKRIKEKTIMVDEKDLERFLKFVLS